LVRALQAFGEEERVSVLFGELTRAAEHGERLVVPLLQSVTGPTVLAQWLLMSLDHFVHLAALLAPASALRTLAALLLAAGDHELRLPLIALLTGDHALALATLERLFAFAAVHFAAQEVVRSKTLIAALQRSTAEPFASLAKRLAAGSV